MAPRPPGRTRGTAPGPRSAWAGRREVLLPPAARPSRPLPSWLGVVALVGLAMLVCSTVPAVLRLTRLGHDLDRLDGIVGQQEREIRRLQCELRAAEEDTYVYERALRHLLQPPPPPTRR